MLDSGDILIQVDTEFAVAGGYNSVEHMDSRNRARNAALGAAGT